MKEKLLVTGGKGLVGSAIKAEVKLGREFDLVNAQETDQAFKMHKPTHVIHCAGKVGGVGGNMNFKGDYFYDNLMINTNVIEAARKNGVENLVCFLSTCVFPDKVEYPLTEAKVHLGVPHDSNYPYAYAKRMADIQIRAYREQHNINYTSVIPTNIYGPNDNFSLQHGHVMPMLIHKLYKAKRDKTDFTVWGSGKPLREFIYSKDVARLAEWAVKNYNETEPIIFGTSEEVSIKDMVDLLIQEFNFKGKVIFDKDKPEGQFRKPSDNSKLKSYLPDFKFTPFEEGIKETVKWFIENYETARK
jgi:GDP-L-fucose synthase